MYLYLAVSLKAQGEVILYHQHQTSESVTIVSFVFDWGLEQSSPDPSAMSQPLHHTLQPGLTPQCPQPSHFLKWAVENKEDDLNREREIH